MPFNRKTSNTKLCSLINGDYPMAQAVTPKRPPHNPRLDNHPLLASTKPTTLIPMSSYNEEETGFYDDNGTKVFVSNDTKNHTCIRIYKEQTVSYVPKMMFAGMELTKLPSEEECHVKINGQTLGAVWNYHVAELLYRALIADFYIQKPVPDKGSLATLDFEIYVSGYGQTRYERITLNHKGEFEREDLELSYSTPKIKKETK